ncbi:argininosuccinate lyase [Scopulibacillus darangshiensis]|uniref:Argininosuccinate lyase n=1 Tax=Scopulibacillus darangshiensis TaxID=442528 RepID=A0A4R2P8V5_9BACL|nr:argininosuccinate lyase [Scopulibacillus darangshiensis]TCP31322.1 argininosuccinate lyase [Scopulibacillus darangshiensis]
MVKRDAFIKSEGCTFPGCTYVETLLKPVFNDQKENLFEAMMALHKAHVVMLNENDLLAKKDTKTILLGLKELNKMNMDQLKYDPDYEDLFFLVEAKLGSLIGDELAGKIHIARSRNDLGEGMYRFVIRNHLLSLIADTNLLCEALLEQAEEHSETIMPAHTHTQPAQPTTLGHYLTAIFDNVQGDLGRLWHAYETVNQSPLGAAAITTTSFSISRERLAELLGYKGLVENSYNAIATGDYLLSSAQSIISLMVNTGRWIQEFLRFASKEVGLLKVADPYVQISSIMPQKRNPVSIEHSRALASSSMGEAMTAIQMLHNTPYGDIVDTEDDMQPHLYNSFKKASRVMRLMHAVIRTMSIDHEHAANEAKKNLITITELADVLTRDHGMSFRMAHQKASQIAKLSLKKDKELYEWEAEEINHVLSGVKLTGKEWQAIADPKVFIERRSICGGPCPSEVRRMINNRKKVLKREEEKYQQVQCELKAANNELEKQVNILIQN